MKATASALLLSVVGVACSSSGVVISGPLTSSGALIHTGSSNASSGSAAGSSTGSSIGTSTGPSRTSTGTSTRSATGSSTGSSTGAATGVSYAGFVGVTQRANDLARDAVYIDLAFTKAAVSAKGSLHVDPTFNGPTFQSSVFAAPLYFVNSSIGKDLVIVADEGNNVFALDAADGSVVWQRMPLVAPAPASAMSCGNISPTLGITGTPVIDPATRTLFLDAVTTDAQGHGDHQIYALSLDDGSTVAGWPIDFSTLTTTLGNGTHYSFYSPDDSQRGALTLVNGVVYVPYGGLFGDCGNYHGAVIAVEEANPANVTAWATTVHQAGIWSPGGIASDGTNLFVATGNGDGNAEGGGTWLGGEGILKLGPGPTFSNATTDYFAPSDYVDLDNGDTDLGSVAPILFDFNDPLTGLRHLAYDMGKTDNAYLVDQENLGGIEGEISGPTVSSGWIDGSLAAYTTKLATYVTYNGPYVGTCPNGASANLNALKVNPSTATTPIIASIAWCGPNNDIGAPLVSMSDNENDDVMVWSIGGNNLYAYDGDTGAIIGSVGVGYVQYWNTPIIAKGRMFMTPNSTVIAVLP